MQIIELHVVTEFDCFTDDSAMMTAVKYQQPRKRACFFFSKKKILHQKESFQKYNQILSPSFIYVLRKLKTLKCKYNPYITRADIFCIFHGWTVYSKLIIWSFSQIDIFQTLISCCCFIMSWTYMNLKTSVRSWLKINDWNSLYHSNFLETLNFAWK